LIRRQLKISLLLCMATAWLPAQTLKELEAARDKQDRATLDKGLETFRAQASAKPNDAFAARQLAQAALWNAETAMELRDKNGARRAAEEGIRAAQNAVRLQPKVSEHHRLLGTLCGQVIPANVLLGLKYGRCAMDEVKVALEMDNKSALNWLSRGVGNYYLPESFGGNVNAAIDDLKKATTLQPSLADAHLWLGIALRKANRNMEARVALQQALKLNPQRAWARQQLEKTPER
jgi:tetratricopeptide (TPR) repeat protein